MPLHPLLFWIADFQVLASKCNAPQGNEDEKKRKQINANTGWFFFIVHY